MGSLTYRWDFDDGIVSSSGTSPDITHAYTDEGIYQAILSVTDPDGSSNSATVEITIENVAPFGGIMYPVEGDEFTTGSRISFA
ncbi:MAG: PKD domain-containing protein, partial [Thermoplasmata archaeon]|nr:PKD domain-containing protein [Thermoplasmata archaeon]NIS19870.1 PKD domain-containing protein [Thermoplasmata archaeon]NIT77065.1 PKD domain-containing protein [Thermoplasmata archaeon]NIW88690.1 PKD domain-containing protein [Thermoplasmata archaeon]NIY03436.1 PKD domain-containing protein [Thermoplasmata archaeon]